MLLSPKLSTHCNSFSCEQICKNSHIAYFLDQTPPLNSRRTQIVVATFTYLSFIVVVLELSLHILIRAHLPCWKWRRQIHCCQSQRRWHCHWPCPSQLLQNIVLSEARRLHWMQITGYRKFGIGLEVPCTYSLSGKPTYIKSFWRKQTVISRVRLWAC